MRANENKHSQKNFFPLSGKRSFIEKRVPFSYETKQKKGKKDKKRPRRSKKAPATWREGMKVWEIDRLKRDKMLAKTTVLISGEDAHFFLMSLCYIPSPLFPSPRLLCLSVSRYLIFSRTLSRFFIKISWRMSHRGETRARQCHCLIHLKTNLWSQ